MEEYIVVQVWNNIGDMTFKTTHKTKENAISVMKKFQEIENERNYNMKVDSQSEFTRDSASINNTNDLI